MPGCLKLSFMKIELGVFAFIKPFNIVRTGTFVIGSPKCKGKNAKLAN